MSRVTHIDFLREAYAPESGVALILLMTITHPDLAEPIRISTDPTARISETTTDVIYGTTSRTNDYLFVPLQLTLPSQTEEGPVRMRVTLDNVSRDLTATVRSLVSPPSFLVELVTSDDVDTVLASWPEFLLINVQYDASTISGELVLETLVHEPFPAGTFNPSEFPGLH